MIAVIQRVKNACVTVDGNLVSEINRGLLVLLGIEKDDTDEDMKKLCDKISLLRIFTDENDKMNLSIIDIAGEILLVSQFTLCADCKKGRRPSFDKAQKSEIAKEIFCSTYNYIKNDLKLPCKTGEFGADMQVNLLNDGPVTIIINSKEI